MKNYDDKILRISLKSRISNCKLCGGSHEAGQCMGPSSDRAWADIVSQNHLYRDIQWRVTMMKHRGMIVKKKPPAACRCDPQILVGKQAQR